MTEVYGILTGPTGRPLQRQRVVIKAVTSGNPFTDDGSAVATVDSVDTDGDGRWTANLIPTADYENAGAYYTADWRLSRGQPDSVFAFTVPSSGGPVNFRDHLIAPPDPGTPLPPVAAHGLGDHIDVDLTGLVDGDVLTFVLADGKWEPLPAGTGPGGGVQDVTAADATIVVGGTSTHPTVRVNGAALTAVPQSAVTGLVAALSAKYEKPGAGIPGSDLTAAVQTLLAAAGTAVQPGGLAAVAFSGAYADISGRPVLATVATTGAYVDLTGKPVLAPVATSGAYADLTGKPTIPTTPGEVGAQPADADLTAIAALAPADGALIRRTAGAWTSGTVAQLKTDLALAKGDVGLGNVDNTADLTKPVSTATQAALDGKQPLDADLTTFAGLAPADGAVLRRTAGAWAGGTVAQLKTDFALAKSDVGLSNVDNTSDLSKPISTAAQAALDAKQALDSDLTTIAGLAPADDSVMQRKAGAWTGRTPAQLKTDLALTKGDVGLSNVDNTADTAKPVSTAQQTALDGKQPLDSDLTAIAALAPSNGATLRRSGGTWIADDGNVALTDAANIATDAAAGLVFTVTLGGNRTLSAPTNPRDTMKRTWRFRQDATGSRTITLDAVFALGSNIANTTLNGTANKVGYMTAMYDSTAAKWHVLAFEPGA